VDGGSRDSTVEKIAAAARRDNRIRVIEAGVATPGRGRNLGIAAARHEWIALTDAGIRLEPGWLQALVAAVESDPEAKVVYGNFEPVTTSFFERCASLAYVPPKATTKAGLTRGPSIASCLIHREVWKAAGAFPDLRASEDLVFMERVRALGTATAHAPGATVWWNLQPSLELTFRKFALYSKHNVLAGRARYWHYGVARMYLAGLPFLLLALIASPWWILLPVMGFALRVAKSIWDRRESLEVLSLLNPIQFVAVGLIIAVIDLATFVGWGEALLESNGWIQGSGASTKPSS
jgi:glycosyltransferase involved in cell wall biosynthesis